MSIRPRRSALFLPASNARAIDKARSLACDVVILDLEDAVAPEHKVTAREQALAAMREGAFGDREVVLRINGLSTRWGSYDCQAAADAGFDAVLLTKVSHASDLSAARAILDVEGPPVWAMIETCAAMLDLPAIVAAAGTQRLCCLVAGTNDLAKEMRCTPGADRLPLLPHLTAIVTAARAAGINALDGVCNTLEDSEVLAAECAQGARLGFDGKAAIHPAQIAAIHRAFTPSSERIAWAERVIAAYALPENADKGAIRVEGEMVERLHLTQASQIVAVAR